MMPICFFAIYSFPEHRESNFKIIWVKNVSIFGRVGLVFMLLEQSW